MVSTRSKAKSVEAKDATSSTKTAKVGKKRASSKVRNETKRPKVALPKRTAKTKDSAPKEKKQVSFVDVSSDDELNGTSSPDYIALDDGAVTTATRRSIRTDATKATKTRPTPSVPGQAKNLAELMAIKPPTANIHFSAVEEPASSESHKNRPRKSSLSRRVFAGKLPPPMPGFNIASKVRKVSAPRARLSTGLGSQKPYSLPPPTPATVTTESDATILKRLPLSPGWKPSPKMVVTPPFPRFLEADRPRASGRSTLVDELANRETNSTSKLSASSTEAQAGSPQLPPSYGTICIQHPGDRLRMSRPTAEAVDQYRIDVQKRLKNKHDRRLAWRKGKKAPTEECSYGLDIARDLALSCTNLPTSIVLGCESVEKLDVLVDSCSLNDRTSEVAARCRPSNAPFKGWHLLPDVEAALWTSGRWSSDLASSEIYTPKQTNVGGNAEGPSPLVTERSDRGILIQSRIMAMFDGILIGNALGLSLDLSKPTEKLVSVSAWDPPYSLSATFEGFQFPRGSYSTAGATTLATARALVDGGGHLWYTRLISRLTSWSREGKFSVVSNADGHDVASPLVSTPDEMQLRTTLQAWGDELHALSNMQLGWDKASRSKQGWDEEVRAHFDTMLRRINYRFGRDTGPYNVFKNLREQPALRMLCSEGTGNSSLTRVAPFGALPIAPFMIQRFARMQSDITHPKPICGDICAVYTSTISLLLYGGDKDDVRDLLREFPATSRELRQRLVWMSDEFNGHNTNPTVLSPSSHAVATFEVAIWAFLSSSDFVSGARLIARLGKLAKETEGTPVDMENIMAVFGGLTGAAYGSRGLPKELVRTLPCRGVIEREVRDFIDMINQMHATSEEIIEGLSEDGSEEDTSSKEDPD